MSKEHIINLTSPTQQNELTLFKGMRDAFINFRRASGCEDYISVKSYKNEDEKIYYCVYVAHVYDCDYYPEYAFYRYVRTIGDVHEFSNTTIKSCAAKYEYVLPSEKNSSGRIENYVYITFTNSCGRELSFVFALESDNVLSPVISVDIVDDML